MSAEDTTTWYPRDEHIAHSNVSRLVKALGVADYDALYRFSIEKPDAYWRAVNRFCGIVWAKDYSAYADLTRGRAFPDWWVGGELNWVDTIIAHADDPACASRNALVAESESGEVTSVTYPELKARVRSFAAGLTKLGLKKGDRIGIFLEPGIESAVSFLAVAYIGAIAISLYSGFGVDPILSRLSPCGTRALIATTGFRRRGQPVSTSAIAIEVRDRLALEFLIFKVPSGEAIPVPDASNWNDLAATVPPGDQTSARTLPQDPFMIVHTSGTSGKPKGTVHTHGGFPLKIAHDAAVHFDIKAGDIFFWPADMGWIAGALTMAAALMHRGTMICYDGAPNYPDWSRMAQMIARHKVTHFSCGPTMIRGFAANEDEALKGDVSSIRILITGGEAIDPEHFCWHQRHFGHGVAPVINYSGGTEVSGALVSSVVVKPIEAAGFNTASPGIDVDVIDSAGASITGTIGDLAVRAPFIGMTKSFWEDDERYLDAYWRTIPDIWVHGDLAMKTQEGGFFVLGRSDDTIKVAGKRLGPAEIEEVLHELSGVSEAAAIGVEDANKGQMLVLFVVPSSSGSADSELNEGIARHVEARLGKLYRPGRVHQVRQLPKTRSSKVMRRVIRAAYCGLPMGDLSALDNPAAIDDIAAIGTRGTAERAR